MDLMELNTDTMHLVSVGRSAGSLSFLRSVLSDNYAGPIIIL